jgi:branched-chain amino acid transport system substrate-binding protein
MFRQRASRLLLITTVLAVALSAGGCGSSHSSRVSNAAGSATPAASVTASGANASAAAPAGTPIVIGTICACSGPDASSDALTGPTLKMWGQWVNASGGINGHPVKVDVMDDNGSAATSLAAAKTLVQQDHVVAIVGEQTAQDITWAKYVESAGVPVIGGGSYSPPMNSNPDFFPSGGTLAAANYGLVDEAVQQGQKKLSLMVCAEAPICATYVDAFRKLVPGFFGGSVVYSSTIAASAPNYTAQCVASKQAGADALFVESFSPVIARVHTDCAAQSYSPGQYGISATVDLSSQKPTTVIQYNLSIADTKTVAGQELQAAIDKYAPSGFRSNTAYTDNLMQVWAGALLFTAAAKASHLSPSSPPAELKQGLYSLKNYTDDGASPPLTFTPSKPTVVSCWFTETRVKKQITGYSTTPTCVPTGRVAQLYEWFKA